ncbi:hypothetical protein V7128_22980 [Neobacillus vireti]|uniref:hypothetical protein n=1 Tax=Neobacillus vireti TaxID=220686 RepID=UPI002FFF649D
MPFGYPYPYGCRAPYPGYPVPCSGPSGLWIAVIIILFILLFIFGAWWWYTQFC